MSTISTVISAILATVAFATKKQALYPFGDKLASNCGGISIVENGETVTRYVVSTNPGGVSVNGDSLSLSHNAGASIAKSASDGYTSDMYQEYILANKTFTFTVDLSSIGCSCDAAITVVSMPGYDSNNQATAGDYGTYYCDANKVNGVYCWEYDFMEANMYVSQTTPHSCTSNAGGYISSCDGGGCATNSYYVNSGGLCPSSSCKINTQSPFTQALTFYGDSKQYQMHAILSQNGNTFEYDICWDNEGYRQTMQQPLEYGMAIALVYWGDSYGDMSWLDSMTGCTGDCPGSGAVTFSGISVNDISNEEYKHIELWNKNKSKNKNKNKNKNNQKNKQ